MSWRCVWSRTFTKIEMHPLPKPPISLPSARGFAPGHELEDWLQAENEVDARLSGECSY